MEVVSKTKPFSSQSSSLLLLPEVVGGWKLSDCQVKTQRSCHNNNSSLNFSHWKKDTQSSRLMDLATEVISSDGYCLWWTNTCCHQSLSVISVCWISLLKNEESLASEQFADHPVPFLSLSAGRLWQTQTLSLRGRITLVYFVQTEEEVWSDFVDSSGWRNMPRPLVWCTCRTNAPPEEEGTRNRFTSSPRWPYTVLPDPLTIHATSFNKPHPLWNTFSCLPSVTSK